MYSSDNFILTFVYLSLPVIVHE